MRTSRPAHALPEPAPAGILRRMSSPAHSGRASACIPNIDASGRRQRRTLGIAMLAVGAAAAGWLLARGAAPAAGVPLVVPFALGLLGVLQARAQTCVRLAARGLRAGGNG